MMPPAELKALEAAVAALETQDERRFCARNGAELAASDETEGRVCLCRCPSSGLPLSEATPVANSAENFPPPYPRATFESGKQLTRKT